MINISTMARLFKSIEAEPEVATNNRQRVMAFDLETGGHHPSYIRNFAAQWSIHSLPADIDFVVTQQFFKCHADVVETVSNLDPKSIRIQAISDEEENRWQSSKLLRERYGWKLFCSYARKLNADRALLMYGDRYQLPIILGQRSPCPFSCIYFRPTFHYTQLSNYQPTLGQRFTAFRKQVLLQRMLAVRQLEVLFCLDPIAVDYITRNLSTQARIGLMPDSFASYVIPPSRIEELRSELAIEHGRKVLLLLGSLDRRKGPLQLLAAAENLASDLQSELCLLLVGNLHQSIANDVLAQIEKLNAKSNIQIVLRNEYISDTIVQEYYELADIALTTYQNHYGMSSVLIRAGLAGIPVLSSDYALLGELVRNYGLGVVVDTTSPQCFTSTLERVITHEPKDLFDADKAFEFANQHSPEALAKTLANWVEYKQD